MELPFAVVENPDGSMLLNNDNNNNNHSNASSLVTASSQGSTSVNMTGSSLAASPAAVRRVPERPQQHIYTHPKAPVPEPSTEAAIDFTYVTVCEEDADDDEVDIVINGGEVLAANNNNSNHNAQQRGDVLALLLSGEASTVNERFVMACEEATQATQEAFRAKDKGNMQHALDAHTRAAKLFRNAATEIRDRDASLANSLLLLSKAQASSALALKRILKLLPSSASDTKQKSHKDRLLATVRGALVTKNEADISDSQFLGRATSNQEEEKNSEELKREETKTEMSAPQDNSEGTNPVDDMMELEKVLRNMDMALELGNSIASLSSRASTAQGGRLMMDGEGSFCVVPPGSASYMSSSTMWASSSNNPPRRPRAKNRVQTVATSPRTTTPANVPSSHHVVAPPPPPPAAKPPHAAAPGLESSWWGHTSTTMTASQALASSIMGGPRADNVPGQPQQQPADTKQLMRLLDSLRTLGEENAVLLREVEEAEAARAEARAARSEMKRFKEQYGTRFEALKAALEKFRKGYPQQQPSQSNPVSSSNYSRTSVTEELQKKDQLIRKLKGDLKKEMTEGKKKDAALRKYESFYREVKARSAQKAAQRQKEAQMLQQRTNKVPRVPR